MFEKFEKQMETCATCPSLCQSACPVFSGDSIRTHAPWGLMQAMNRVRKGELELTPEIAALSYHCLTCLGCTQQCEHGIELPPVMLQARQAAVKQEIAPKEIAGFLEKFHRHNNPFSRDLLKKLKNTLIKKYFQRDAAATYFASCTTIAKCPEIIKDTFTLFDKLKIHFVSPYAEPIQCCGYPLFVAGAEYDFVDLAEINYHALKKHKTIITGSPACAYTLKKTYADYDFNLSGQVITINEFLGPFLKNINYKLKKNLRTRLMYHDPCYLSRYLKQTDLPREMIARVSGYPPTEFYRNRLNNMCSGQGGCYSLVAKDRAARIAADRLSECREKNIHMVVTQCPTCVFKMRKNGQKIIVKDLVSYLNDSIEGSVA